MRKLRIARGGKALGTLTEPDREVSWKALYQRLERSDETGDKASVGFWVGGHFNAPERLSANLIARSVVVLDVDYLESWELDPELFDKAFAGLAFAAHSTWSHTADRPRLRVAIPLSRDVSRDEYEPIARVLANRLSIDAVDRASYKFNQLMYWPSHTAGAATFFHGTYEEQFANPDTLLATLTDWSDPECWPYRDADRAETAAIRVAKNPHKAPGVIGVFNKLFTIQHAINAFALPYAPGSNEVRYSYVHGSGHDGARIYDHLEGPENCFLYSDHDTDPARGNNTAWDLVRIHKFGSLDKDQPADTPIGKRESQRQMQAFALSLPDVTRVLAGEEGFEVELDEQGEVQRKVRINYDTIRRQVDEIADNEMGEAQRKEFVTQIAVARIEPSEVSILAGMVRQKHCNPKPSKQAVLDDIKLRARQLASGTVDGEAKDIEISFVKRFLDIHFAGGEHMRHFASQFWIYEHGVWRIESEEIIRGMMQALFIELREERPADAKALVAAVGETKTSSLVNVLSVMLADHIAARFADPDPLGLMKPRDTVINCLNGELHFTRDGTYEFTDHHPELFLTAQIPVNWDPDAQCPEWDHFCSMIFDESLESDELQRHLEELGGYLAQPSRWLKTWVLLMGPANAGKTTIGKVFEALLGGATVERPMASYDGSNNHAEAGLVGKLMLLDEDFTKGSLLPDGFLKRISEEKTLTANPKGAAEYNFICRALPVILSNHWPPTRDLSDALLIRAQVFHLQRPIRAHERSDAKQALMLSDDLPGILVRFVEGFCRLRKRNVWDIPDECLVARGEWQVESNAAARFARECLLPAPGQTVAATRVWSTYCGWQHDEGGSGYRLGRNTFVKALAQLGYARKRGQGSVFWVFADVKLSDEAEEQFE